MTDSGELIRSRYIDKLTQLKGNGMVKALSGMRNVGKTEGRKAASSVWTANPWTSTASTVPT